MTPPDRPDLRAALGAFAGLLEAEWYNGNLDEKAYLRLNADLTGIRAKYLGAIEAALSIPEPALPVPALDALRLARAMHLARLLPDTEEPYCDNPLTDADLAGHMRWAEAILHAARMLPPYGEVMIT